MKYFNKRLSILLIFLVGVISLSFSAKKDNKSTPSFSYGETIATIRSEQLHEISGMVRSVLYKDCYWVHNDSGGEPAIYLIDLKGRLIATVLLTGLVNRDWEDIATDNGYLYIGEVGDNNSIYSSKTIYRIKEPTGIDTKSLDANHEVSSIDSMVFNFADKQRDCESLMADPISGDLIMFSKREPSVLVYQTPFIPTTSDAIEIEPKLTVDITQITAADISADGSEILAKNYNEIYYWSRNPKTESVLDALAKKPTKLNYIAEAQGEAIAWNKRATIYYTTSEFAKMIKPLIRQYRRFKFNMELPLFIL